MAAEALLATLPLKMQGPEDVVPDEGGKLDRITIKILKKLAKQPAPVISETVLFPERHPAD